MKNKFCFFILTLLTTCFISSFCLKLINKKDILLKGKYLIKYLSYLDYYDYVFKNNSEVHVDITSPYSDLKVLSKSKAVKCKNCYNTGHISVIPEETFEGKYESDNGESNESNTAYIEPVQHIDFKQLAKDKQIKVGSHSTSQEGKEKNESDNGESNESNTAYIEPVQHIDFKQLAKDKQIKVGSHSTSQEGKEKNIRYKFTFKFKLDNNKENKENKDKKVYIGTPDLNIKYKVIIIDEKKYNDFKYFNDLDLSSDISKFKIFQKTKKKL